MIHIYVYKKLYVKKSDSKTQNKYYKVLYKYEECKTLYKWEIATRVARAKKQTKKW